jgi:putative membrane protein
MKAGVRAFLLLLGVALFAWFLHRAGPAEIWRTCSKLGWLALLMLLPYAAVSLADALGWRFAFGKRWPRGFAFWTLYRVRWSGEAVNNVVPSAYVGGEAIKVYLLHKRGISAADATASVVAGRTIQTLTQVTFIGLGALALTHVTGRDSRLHWPALFVLGGSIAAIVILFWMQTHGMFALMLNLLQRLRLQLPRLEARRRRLYQIDRQIVAFYREERSSFLKSAAAYFCGWLLDATDILLASHLLGLPIQWTQALAIEAFIGVAKILGLFVPGAIGVQESGIALVCQFAGAPESLGPAYAIIRRAREAVYASFGWLLLYLDEASLKGLSRRIISQTQRV